MVKILLVAGVIWAFLIANQIIMQNQVMLQQHVDTSVQRLEQSAAGNPQWQRAKPAPHFPWRKLPGAKLHSHRSWKMNDVPFMEGEYEVTGSPEKVLDFYRGGMARAGWKDITESYFNIDPEFLAQSGQMEILQSSNFMEKYRKITEANLILRRGQKSVYVTIRPPGNKRWRTTYNLTHAETPSAKDIWIDTYTRARHTSYQRPYTKQFNMEEDIRDKRMQSVTFTSHLPPQSMYDRMSREMLEQRGWQKEAIPVGLKFPSGSQVQAFVQGKSFALLSVRYDETMRMSTALLTTENPQ